MSETVLVIGSGSREHTIVWKLLQSPKVKKIYVAPGNGGTKSLDDKVSNLSLDIKDPKAVTDWCKTNRPSLVIVGPEDPLDKGVGSAVRSIGIPCFGPDKEASQIECSKSFAKDFMKRHSIPTGQYENFTDASKAKSFVRSACFKALVVKASGLAAGKGVIVAKDVEEACKHIDAILTDRIFGDAGNEVVIEELLVGDEVSVLAFSDGVNVSLMPPSQDRKRAYENDEGPNTGGMGAYCPYPFLSKEEIKHIETVIIQKTIDGLRSEGKPFIGTLFAGLMLTENGPKVIEFNCRFGDPETQSILPLLESDLYSTCLACANGNLNSALPSFKENTTVCGVVIASGGYPASATKGQVIEGLKELEKNGLLIFHGGTEYKDGQFYTAGGRVLAVVAVANDLTSAAKSALIGAEGVKINKSFYRKDIAKRSIDSLDYKASGVDINAGNELVNHIKKFAKNTNRSGVIDQIGGFGALFDLKNAGYLDPILVSGTDGVGTKLKIAIETNILDTVGQDLVAMCVNDILVQGAEPLFFLDYFASSKLVVADAAKVIEGISRGCQLANCALIGGETAEMPGMYAPGDFDLAGFAVGAVDRQSIIPRIKDIQEGDMVIGIPSSGVHSNGFSLVRKVLELNSKKYTDATPFDRNSTFADILLTPTKIYVKSLLPVIKLGFIKALSHITGGGLLENIPRIMPSHLGVTIDANKWEVPEIFRYLQSAGNIKDSDMLKTFNCGLGMVIIVAKEDSDLTLKTINAHGESGHLIGHVTKREDEPVIVHNFSNSKSTVSSEKKKRVAVLVSGSGTNIQALIEHTQDKHTKSNAKIVLVISNKEDAPAIEKARAVGIKTLFINHKVYSKRVDYDMEMHKALTEAQIDIVCLAGFMRILSDEFTTLWEGKMINVHPSLLPSFKGMHAYKQAIDAGCRITGCSVHFVSPALDSGAIILQETVPILLQDDEESLSERGKRAEHKIYPQALELLAMGKVGLEKDGKIRWNL